MPERNAPFVPRSIAQSLGTVPPPKEVVVDGERAWPIVPETPFHQGGRLSMFSPLAPDPFVNNELTRPSTAKSQPSPAGNLTSPYFEMSDNFKFSESDTDRINPVFLEEDEEISSDMQRWWAIKLPHSNTLETDDYDVSYLPEDPDWEPEFYDEEEEMKRLAALPRRAPPSLAPAVAYPQIRTEYSRSSSQVEQPAFQEQPIMFQPSVSSTPRRVPSVSKLPEASKPFGRRTSASELHPVLVSLQDDIDKIRQGKERRQSALVPNSSASMLALLKEAEEPVRESEVDDPEADDSYYPVELPAQQPQPIPAQAPAPEIKPVPVSPTILPAISAMDEVIKPAKKILVVPAPVASTGPAATRKPSIPVVSVSSTKLNEKCSFLGNCTCIDCRPDLHKAKK
jgi:hypothetical protein